LALKRSRPIVFVPRKRHWSGSSGAQVLGLRDPDRQVVQFVEITLAPHT
jgi:hypothetical protein